MLHAVMGALGVIYLIVALCEIFAYLVLSPAYAALVCRFPFAMPLEPVQLDDPDALHDRSWDLDGVVRTEDKGRLLIARPVAHYALSRGDIFPWVPVVVRVRLVEGDDGVTLDGRWSFPWLALTAFGLVGVAMHITVHATSDDWQGLLPGILMTIVLVGGLGGLAFMVGRRVATRIMSAIDIEIFALHQG